MKKLFKIRDFPLSISEKIIITFLLMMAEQHAIAFTAPGLTTLGCEVLKWMTSELSIIIFFIIIVVTLLVGFFAKMDWTKILGVIVLFGLMKGAGTMFGSFVTLPPACTSAFNL